MSNTNTSTQPTNKEITPAPAHQKKDGLDLPFGVHVLITCAIAYSPSMGFCFRFWLINFSTVYLGFRISSHSSQKGSQHLLFLPLLICLIVWCFFIAPETVFGSTSIIVGAQNSVHQPPPGAQILYDAGKNAKVDIIEVGGHWSNIDTPLQPKSNNETSSHWLKDLLPYSEGFKNTRIATVNYQIDKYELRHQALSLLEHVHNMRNGTHNRPIIFLAHGFEGIVLKKALLLARSRDMEIGVMARGIMFLGVPHLGMNFALAASCLSCNPFFQGSSHLSRITAPKQSELSELELLFVGSQVVQHGQPQPKPYICDVYETQPERIGKATLGSLSKTPQSHVAHGQLLALETDHKGLNQFQSHSDPNYQMFLASLRRAYNHAVPTIGDGSRSKKP